MPKETGVMVNKRVAMIEDWNTLENFTSSNLLIGNGFSISISGRFNYPSLIETFGENQPIGRYWCTRELFTKFNTSNFEEVLRGIYHAFLVSIDNEDAIITLYNDLKNALINAICNVHPSYDEINTSDIAAIMQNYRSIYTTNYDLIPYWSILTGNTDQFRDFFWGDDLAFDKNDTDIHGNNIPIYYLHGAIHLKSTALGGAKKSRVELSQVNSYFRGIEFGEFPLFITEGNYKLKMHRINENDYLRFCYERLSNQSGNLVIYGHSLSKEYDYHIVESIKNSGIEEIAVSVYSGLDEANKELFVAKINELFYDSGKEVVFFSSDTHPLCLD